MPSRSGERCIALSLILSSLGIAHLVDCNDMTFIPIAAALNMHCMESVSISCGGATGLISRVAPPHGVG